MIDKELQLSVSLLEMASKLFSIHGCYDVPENIYNGWTTEERRQFVKEYHEWNGDLESYDENFLLLPDYALMKFMSYKIKKQL